MQFVQGHFLPWTEPIVHTLVLSPAISTQLRISRLSKEYKMMMTILSWLS